MILLVDAGNTRIKWARRNTETGAGLLQPGGGGSAVYAAHSTNRGESTECILDSRWGDYPAPTRVLVSNVGGREVAGALVEWSAERWGVEVELISSIARGWGVVSAYEQPATLGVDRWVALVAAYHVVAGPCCVIDCGTAVTVDALAAGGRHLGGIIMPGAALMRRALLESTSEIFTDQGLGELRLAANTGDAVASGTAYAVVAGIERVVTEIEVSIRSPLRRLVTGGDAGFVHSILRGDSEIHPELVLEGLAIMAGDDS